MTREGEAIEQLTDFALQTIKEAGKIALSHYGKAQRGTRFDEELVTEAELRLSTFFQDSLAARFPEHRIFTNHQEPMGYSHAGERYLWVFDPLDGVANFQGGIPIWGMSLAVLENAWPVFGVFYMPATGDLFHARAGRKAYRGDREIHAFRHTEINDESVLLTYSRFHNTFHTTFPGKIRSFGCTAAHICYVAGGQADAAIFTHETYQDLAAAQLIAEASGAKIYRMDGEGFQLNESLDGDKTDEHLIMATPETSALIRETIKRIP